MITLYGITNCDTVKKARTWLEDHHINYRFHDFRKESPGRPQLKALIAELGWETLVNKRSTTWKNLDESTRQLLNAVDESNEGFVVDLILDQPTLIKRPLLDTGKQRIVGFTAANYQTLLLP